MVNIFIQNISPTLSEVIPPIGMLQSVLSLLKLQFSLPELQYFQIAWILPRQDSLLESLLNVLYKPDFGG